jgi:hypothetical protein
MDWRSECCSHSSNILAPIDSLRFARVASVVLNYTGRGGGLGAKAGPPVHTYLRQPTKILWCALILSSWRRTSTKAKECVGSHSFAQILRPHITHQHQRIRWLALVCQVCTYLYGGYPFFSRDIVVFLVVIMANNGQLFIGGITLKYCIHRWWLTDHHTSDSLAKMQDINK